MPKINAVFYKINVNIARHFTHALFKNGIHLYGYYYRYISLVLIHVIYYAKTLTFN